MGIWTDNFVFQRGYVYERERLYFLTSEEEMNDAEIANAQLFILRNGKWFHRVVDWDAVGLTITKTPSQTLVVLGREGDVLIGTTSGFTEETIYDEDGSLSDRGPMRNISTIDGVVFAVGMNRQVYRRRGDNNWIRYEEGLPEEIGMYEVAGLNSIDGLALDDLYTVGWEGEIWHHSGKKWHQIESPTNLALFDVHVVHPDLVYACGQLGMLLRSKDDRWEIVEYEGTQELEFISLAWFNDKLYLSDGHSLHVLKGNKLSLVDFGVDGIVPSSHLHANDGILLSVAGKEVFTTADGFKWEEVPC